MFINYRLEEVHHIHILLSFPCTFYSLRLEFSTYKLNHHRNQQTTHGFQYAKSSTKNKNKLFYNPFKWLIIENFKTWL